MKKNPNHINSLLIENFKSVKHLEIAPKRINIFVGKPNVGKSNILEALSMLSNLPSFNDVVRFSHTYQLFYDNDVTQPIKIITNLLSGNLFKEKNNLGFQYLFGTDEMLLESIAEGGFSSVERGLENADDKLIVGIGIKQIGVDETGRFDNHSSFGKIESNIRRYSFSSEKSALASSSNSSFLNAPNGDNLFTILSTNKSLRQDVVSFFEEYG